MGEKNARRSGAHFVRDMVMRFDQVIAEWP
jgi:hypothetical protein